MADLNNDVTSQASGSAYSDMPVVLSLQLATKSVPLSEIEGLKSGDILPFDMTLSNQVTLLTNGAPLAKAELVELDGKVAVRLLKLLG